MSQGQRQGCEKHGQIAVGHRSEIDEIAVADALEPEPGA